MRADSVCSSIGCDSTYDQWYHVSRVWMRRRKSKKSQNMDYLVIGMSITLYICLDDYHRD